MRNLHEPAVDRYRDYRRHDQAGGGFVKRHRSFNVFKPHKAHPIHMMDGKAWWYGDATGICVYIHDGKNAGMCCRIPRRSLRDWLLTTEQKP